MTDTIDHSAIAESRIALQYQSSAKFRAFIRALMSQSQELEGVFQSIASSRDIDAAEGVQLDVIGEIVGVSRVVDGVIVTPHFNFNGALLAEPFGEEGNLSLGGRFYEEGEPTAGSSVLADPEYRLLIRAKIARNHAKGTNDDILQALSYLFDGAPAGIIDDVGGMAVDIGIGRPITAIEYALITELDILPRPAGVRINRIINYFGETGYFGFDGMPGALGFGEEGDPSVGGRWAEDITDGVPEYPDPPVCLFALGATLGEIQAVFGPSANQLTMDVTEQIGSRTLAGSLGSQWEGYAMSTAAIPLDAAGTAVDVNLTMQATGGFGGGTGAGTAAGVTFYNEADTGQSVAVRQASRGAGDFLQTVVINGTSVYSGTTATPADTIGVRFDGASVQVKIDNVSVSAGEFTAASVIPVENIIEYAGLPAGDAGKSISVGLGTSGITTIWAAGTKDACGNVILP